MARALQALGPFFQSKISTGTEPLDVLHGIMLGISGQSTTVKDWRILADSSGNLDIDENTGSDASPSWQTRLTIAAGSAFAAGFNTAVDSGRIDFTANSATEFTADIVSGSITNTYINASAAIALSKLAATTASRALVSDGSGVISPATTTATEIGYVNGVTSAIQTQLNAKIGAGSTATGTFSMGGFEITGSDAVPSADGVLIPRELGFSGNCISFSVADDNVVRIDNLKSHGIIVVTVDGGGGDNTTFNGIIFFQVAANTSTLAGGSDFAHIANSDTPPAEGGSGGTDNKLNFQANATSTPKLWVKNRLGGTLTVRLFFLTNTYSTAVITATQL